MSCMLRAAGLNFAVDKFLSQSRLIPYHVWRKGERRLAERLHAWSGFSMVASEADFDQVQRQIEDAISFLKVNHDELAKLQHFPDIETMYLDFGVEDRDVAAQSDSFPAELLRLAGNLGMNIEITRYPQSDE